jgi:cell division septation protein DedD
VQAGAFRSRDRARALRRALLLAGFDSFLDERATDGGALHVVQTGAFSSRRAAEAHAGRLRARGFDAAVR